MNFKVKVLGGCKEEVEECLSPRLPYLVSLTPQTHACPGPAQSDLYCAQMFRLAQKMRGVKSPA